VTVTALCPGPVATEFQERAGNTDAPPGQEGAGLLRWQEPEQVARAGDRGLSKGRAIAVPGVEHKVLRLPG
jgi:short-subunit dehydrogenase